MRSKFPCKLLARLNIIICEHPNILPRQASVKPHRVKEYASRRIEKRWSKHAIVLAHSVNYKRAGFLFTFSLNESVF